MKKITLLALCLSLFIGAANAQTKINWLKITDVEKSIEKDGKNAKRVFIDCYTGWCGWCKKMDRDTFEDPTIAKIMSHYFYCVKFDAESKEEITFGGKTYKNLNPNASRGSVNGLANVLLNNRLSYPSFSILDFLLYLGIFLKLTDEVNLKLNSLHPSIPHVPIKSI